MSALDTAAIRGRYELALAARPSKGDYTQRGIDALTDSVCDVPTVLARITTITGALDALADRWCLIADNLEAAGGTDPDTPIGHAAAQMRQRAIEVRDALQGALR